MDICEKQTFLSFVLSLCLIFFRFITFLLFLFSSQAFPKFGSRFVSQSLLVYKVVSSSAKPLKPGVKLSKKYVACLRIKVVQLNQSDRVNVAYERELEGDGNG